MDATERDARTPIGDANRVWLSIREWFNANPKVFGAHGGDFDGNDFMALFERMVKEGVLTDPDAAIAALTRAAHRTYLLIEFSAAILCALYAHNAQRDGRPTRAWTYVVDAERLAAHAMGHAGVTAGVGFGIAGAHARHAQDYAAKGDAIAAYLEGNFSSKNAAATAIAGSVVPYNYNRVRRWLQGVKKREPPRAG